MKRDIIWLGCIVALVLLLVKGAEYNLFSRQISVEVFTSILILLFTGLGLWFGLKFTSPAFIIKEVSVEKLNLTNLHASGISEREYQILTLIQSGHTNKQISEQLYISLSTVKSHIQNTYQKLGVKNRTQAILRAKELSLSPST
ncbi:UNVERIFIED_CONTAM: hypothetical protein GTU68_018211 [Idotea baltica]|nr:hypothetical protein [Idotea baltica]